MPKKVIARQGDSIPSLAHQNGHFWETVWNDAGNADLKEKRPSPNQLAPGDVVEIPDLRRKDESGATEQRHRFKRKGVPSILRLQLKTLGDPRPNEKYVLELDGELIEGTTDGDGKLEQPIPPDCKGGRLLLSSLARHEHRNAVEAYGHRNLGFAEKELRRFAEKAGLVIASSEIVTREKRPPHFEVISLLGTKP